MLLLAMGVLTVLGTPVQSNAHRRGDAERTAWVLDAWARSGRPFLASRLGLHFADGLWSEDSTWQLEANTAALAYDAEPVLRAVLAFADAHAQPQLLDEAAGLFLAALGRFRTFGELRAAGLRTGVHVSLNGPDGVRTLPWTHPATATLPAYSTESLLCTTQFLHPAARLIHLIADLPAARRTGNESAFVAAYTPLILQDEVIRAGFQLAFYPAGSAGRVQGMVGVWEATARLPREERRRYPLNLTDLHLWVIGAAAELLAANGADDQLVRLSRSERDQLKVLVASGTRRLLQSRTIRRYATAGREGAQELADYFEGDFARYPDFAYAGDSSAEFPTERDTASIDEVSWDISHLTRLPVVLRSLWDARTETGEPFPTVQDLSQVAQQLEHRVFNGNLAQPLFRNFFDGSDGWYRVGYMGRSDWGIPPSRKCDSRNGSRQCLSLWALPAWGLIAFADTGLSTLNRAMLELATTTDAARVIFRDRYYTAFGRPLVFQPEDGGTPSLLLFELVATFPPDDQ